MHMWTTAPTPSLAHKAATHDQMHHTIIMPTSQEAQTMTQPPPRHLPARAAHTTEPQASAPGAPNWYAAMVETQWTVGTIMRTFGVPRTLARRIQGEFPAYEELCTLLEAHRELCAQVGH